jgi:hypothetical protein
MRTAIQCKVHLEDITRVAQDPTRITDQATLVAQRLSSALAGGGAAAIGTVGSIATQIVASKVQCLTEQVFYAHVAESSDDLPLPWQTQLRW